MEIKYGEKEILDFDINNEENKVVKRQVISEETSKKMRDLLENVVNNGNGNRVKAHNYRVGGKSGTTIKIENGIYTSEKTITSFYSTFPIDNPKYSVLVVVDEPKGENTGNAVAGSISKNINDEIVKLKKLKDKNYSKIGITQVEVPNLIGESLKNAIKILRANELKGNILNTSLNDLIIIKGQSIEPGTLVDKNTIIDLFSDDEGESLVKVPNLLGLRINEVDKILNDIGLTYTFEGDAENGVVTSTIPSKDKYIEPGSKIEIIFDSK